MVFEQMGARWRLGRSGDRGCVVAAAAEEDETTAKVGAAPAKVKGELEAYFRNAETAQNVYIRSVPR
jgi:hypothetical protein